MLLRLVTLLALLGACDMAPVSSSSQGVVLEDPDNVQCSGDNCGKDFGHCTCKSTCQAEGDCCDNASVCGVGID